MKIYHFTPYSLTKNLGHEYNHYLSLIGENDFACLRDGDTMFLTPDWGDIVFNYAYQNPGCVMVCQTNRIHELAREQTRTVNSITEGMAMAEEVKRNLYQTTKCKGLLSGFLMLVPKKIWEQVKFKENGLLGVDTQFYRDLRKKNIPILRMDGLYIWHTYRLNKDIKDTTHLK